MSRKSVMLALAAAVSLGTFALSATDASAFGRSIGAIGAARVGSGMRLAGPLHVNYSHPMHASPMLKKAQVFPMKPVLGIVIKPPHHHHYWWWWSHWRPYWIGPTVVTGAVAGGAVARGGVSYAATAPATNRCNCLTKEYTQDGAVVFKDVCTNEMAMNPPANASPAAAMAPQEPQMPQQPIQQGYLQPQPAQVQ